MQPSLCYKKSVKALGYVVCSLYQTLYHYICYLFSLYKQGVHILLQILQKDCYKSALNAHRSKTPCFRAYTHGSEGSKALLLLFAFAHCSLCKAWEASCFPCSEAVDRRFWPTTLAWSPTALNVVVREVPMLWKAFFKSSRKLAWLPAAMQRSSKTATLILPFSKMTNSFSFLCFFARKISQNDTCLFCVEAFAV